MLTFVTGNSRKIAEAQEILDRYDISLQAQALDIHEIQHHDAIEITKYKARAAYEQLGVPLIVNDSAWSIPALNGFPGGYMKDVMRWFTAEDFLALMRDETDKRIMLIDTTVYIDASGVKVFSNTCEGMFVDEPRGDIGESFARVIAFACDDGLTLAEAFKKQGIKGRDEVYQHLIDFGTWYSTTYKGE